MTVLIADDEELARVTTRCLLDDCKTGITNILEADDGRSLMRQVKWYKPDIAFVDIKMPHLNGLEAIRKVQKESPGTQWIIVTGFQEFDFAREAIDLGVTGFLLKPLSDRDFRLVLDKALDNIRQANDSACLQFENDITALADGKKISLGDDYAYYRVSQIHIVSSLQKPVTAFSEAAASLLRKSYAASLNKSCRFGLISRDEGEFILVESWKKDSSFPAAANTSISGWTNEIRALSGEKSHNFLLYTFRGETLDNTDDLSGELTRIKLTRTSLPSCYPWCINNTGSLANESSFPVFHIINKMMQAYRQKEILLYNSQVNRLSRFTEYFDYRGENNSYRLYVLHLLGLQGTAPGKGSSEEFMQYLKIQGERLKSPGNSRDRHVQTVLQYVADHFTEDLGLNTLAYDLEVTPNYLGALISRKTGKKLTEHIAMARIEYARSLLAETDMTVSDISLKTGYRSTRYFTKIFCKYEGCYPSAFRKKFRN